ncbi:MULTISPECIES: transcription termination factor Rho [unclassified Granulicatella]|uniref:transcription termination factor Rho n=1 Tax=unclassified Granulicatella TaxID=2630493 RepID=UPI0010743221|nr:MULTISPECIES: transcription termination factor Rho [unclassified Granulicatella]MBF0780872.1 transcription termination factor Rho [Granulicatella sp. 19428wC4_WM01]TFU93483.1 transcription termination factor Rho [Granulicatella sp. WM01]
MENVWTLEQLDKEPLKEIYKYAKELNIPSYSQMSKKELCMAVIRAQEETQGFFTVEGVLDIIQSNSDVYGFLRAINYTPSQEDIYISNSQMRRFDLRKGDLVKGTARRPKQGERRNGLMHVLAVNGENPEKAKDRNHFPGLVPIYPNRQITLEHQQKELTTRLIDWVAPIGFGQRGLIVAPPKAGKTSIIKTIAKGIKKNHPDTHLILLLIDERPEEVTDLERSVDGEVVYSTFDQQPENHTRLAELVYERALRLVEERKDVVILMDSITRLARAYNLVIPPSGRTLSGGIDPAAFYKPKRFFGAARNIEDGGSLTIIATALIDTGSRMDDVIYEEFKGTGNMELHLSRELAQRRIFPAIDIKRSGTRREELLLDKKTIESTWKVRNSMKGDSLEYTEAILKGMSATRTNQSYFKALREE